MLFLQTTFNAPTNLLGPLFMVAALAVVWIVVRTVFKIATRVFMIGCAAIVLLGGAMIAFAAYGGANLP